MAKKWSKYSRQQTELNAFGIEDPMDRNRKAVEEMGRVMACLVKEVKVKQLKLLAFR